MHRAFKDALLLSLVLPLAACSGGGNLALPATPPGMGGGQNQDMADAASRKAAGFTETWSEFTPNVAWLDGSVHDRWIDWWNGYGTIAVVKQAASEEALQLAPFAATPAGHSALVTSSAVLADFTAMVAITTRRQLSDAPSPWEVGWLLWHFSDNLHFYAFTPQPNGWELSKEDPAYPGNQRFLATASQPAFPVGKTYSVRVVQRAATMSVWVNGVLICAYVDRERPYLSGDLGLYSEEANVEIGLVTVESP